MDTNKKAIVIMNGIPFGGPMAFESAKTLTYYWRNLANSNDMTERFNGEIHYKVVD